MEEEKTIIKKPPFWLTFQLFIFMMLIIWNFWSLTYNLRGFWWDRISLIPIQYVLIAWVIDFMAYVYAFVAIYKALQRKPYSIMMLKFSVLYILLQSFFRSLGYIGYIIPSLPFFYLPVVFFYVIFLLYLYKSKALKSYLPYQERFFGKFGIMAVFIYLFVFGLYVYLFGESIYKNYNSLPISHDKVQLNTGEYTDGLVIFRPLETWTLDTISGTPDIGQVYLFKDKDNSHITLMALNAPCDNRIDYYLILSQMCKTLIPDTLTLKEIKYNDSIINGFRYYSNTYEIVKKKKQKVYWTFSALVSNNSYKVLTLSIFEKEAYNTSIEASENFMRNVKFDLKQRRVVHEGVDKIENSNDNKKLENGE